MRQKKSRILLTVLFAMTTLLCVASLLSAFFFWYMWIVFFVLFAAFMILAKKIQKIVNTLMEARNKEQIVLKNPTRITKVTKVFTDKYKSKYKKLSADETKIKFSEDFNLEQYALPNGFLEFTKTKQCYHCSENKIELEPLSYEEILSTAYDLICGRDVFDLPPYCIPFAIDKSGHNVYALDYRDCDVKGEPEVILINNELDIIYEYNEDIFGYFYSKNIIAVNFDAFITKCSIKVQDNIPPPKPPKKKR